MPSELSLLTHGMRRQGGNGRRRLTLSPAWTSSSPLSNKTSTSPASVSTQLRDGAARFRLAQMVEVAASSCSKPKRVHAILDQVNKFSGSPQGSRFSVLQDLQMEESLESATKAWCGPIPSPRRSPPRTLGSVISSALQGKRRSAFPSTIQGSQRLPVKNKSTLASLKTPVSSSDPLSSAELSLEFFPKLPVNSEIEKLKSLKSPPASKISIPYRPTPGLVSLFAKTGTARRKGRVTSVSLSPSSFRSYTVVARSAMDRNHRQGFGAGGNGGNGGFARGFHPGFVVGNQHGGAPGGRGRGRGRGRSTGRPGPRHEFSHGGGWNNFGGGHGWSSGFGLNAGPTGGGFNGVGFPAPFGSVARPNGGGVSAGKFGVAPGPSAFPAASGGVFPVGSLPTGGVPSGGLQMDGGGLPSGGLLAVMLTTGVAHAGGASGGELKAAFHMPVVVPGSGLAGDGSSGLVSVSGAVSSSGVLGASSAAAAGQVSSLKIAESGKGIAQHNWQKVDGGGSQARGSGAMFSNTSSGPTAGSSAGGFVPSGGVFGTGKDSKSHGESVQHDMAACVVGGNKAKSKVDIKGSGKPYCFRCLTKGHIMQDCSSKFYCEICESEDHIATRCPIFRSNVKPTA